MGISQLIRAGYLSFLAGSQLWLAPEAMILAGDTLMCVCTHRQKIKKILKNSTGYLLYLRHEKCVRVRYHQFLGGGDSLTPFFFFFFIFCFSFIVDD